MKTGDTYTAKIKATVLDNGYNIIEQRVMHMGTREGRFALRRLANEAHRNGRKLLTEPVESNHQGEES